MSLLDVGLNTLAIKPHTCCSVFHLIVSVFHQVECENCGQCESDGISPYLSFMCHTGFLTMLFDVYK